MTARPAIFRAQRLQREGNPTGALAMMKEVAALGQRRAVFLVGHLLSEAGQPEEAVKWYRRAADAGWATAAYNLGVCYAIGKGVAKDAVESTRWYERAAELGFHEAALVRGTMWANGEGCERSAAKALEWWRRAAAAGLPRAMFYVGECHRTGEGTPQDETEAIGWYLRGLAREEAELPVKRIEALCAQLQERAQAGELPAAGRLGQLHLEGRGVAKDLEAAIRWLSVACDEVPEAACELADCYRTATGVEEDLEEAVRLYEVAALGGNATAQHSLAYARAEGIGGPVDEAEAIRWYRAAAEQGRLDSLDDLGITLQRSDPAGSLSASLDAAERGYAPAQLRVGLLLRDGTCGPRDPVQALRWLFRAVQNGLGDAVHSMHPLGRELTAEQIYEASALADDDGAAAETLSSLATA